MSHSTNLVNKCNVLKSNNSNEPSACNDASNNIIVERMQCVFEKADGTKENIPLKFCQDSAQGMQIDNADAREAHYNGQPNFWAYLTHLESQNHVNLMSDVSYTKDDLQCSVIKGMPVCTGTFIVSQLTQEEAAASA